MTGTLRYMSPEIGRGERYNEKCDVYSFTVLLWEMLTCERPYNQYTSPEKLMRGVFTQGERPKLPRQWDTSLQHLVQSGWSPNVDERATMRQLCRGLQALIQQSDKDKTTNGGNNNNSNGSSHHAHTTAHRHSTVVFPMSQQKRPLLQLPHNLDESLSEKDLARILE